LSVNASGTEEHMTGHSAFHNKVAKLIPSTA